MLVVTRFRVLAVEQDGFLADIESVLTALATRPGFLTGQVARSVDDPGLWVLTTGWEGVGAYRRALSAYDVKLTLTPLARHALDEPSAYEVLASSTGGRHASDRAADDTGRAGITR